MTIFKDVMLPFQWRVKDWMNGEEENVVEYTIAVMEVLAEYGEASVLRVSFEGADHVMRVVRLPGMAGYVLPRMQLSQDMPSVRDVMDVVLRIDASGDVGVNIAALKWEHVTRDGVTLRVVDDDGGFYGITVLPLTYALLGCCVDVAEFRSRLSACTRACLELASVGVVHRRIEPTVFMKDGANNVQMGCLEGSLIPTMLFLHAPPYVDGGLSYAETDLTAYEVVKHNRWVILRGELEKDEEMGELTPNGILACEIGSAVYAGWDLHVTSRPSLRSMLESVGFCMWEWIFGDGTDSCLKWAMMDTDGVALKQSFTRCLFAHGVEISPESVEKMVREMTRKDALHEMTHAQMEMLFILSSYFSRVYSLDFDVNMIDEAIVAV